MPSLELSNLARNLHFVAKKYGVPMQPAMLQPDHYLDPYIQDIVLLPHVLDYFSCRMLLARLRSHQTDDLRLSFLDFYSTNVIRYFSRAVYVKYDWRNTMAGMENVKESIVGKLQEHWNFEIKVASHHTYGLMYWGNLLRQSSSEIVLPPIGVAAHLDQTTVRPAGRHLRGFLFLGPVGVQRKICVVYQTPKVAGAICEPIKKFRGRNMIHIGHHSGDLLLIPGNAALELSGKNLNHCLIEFNLSIDEDGKRGYLWS